MDDLLGNGSARPSKPSTPSNDAFGSLLAPKTQKFGQNVSMQERQRQLLEEKRRQQEQTTQLWENLGSGRSTPAFRQPSPAVPTANGDDDDILAAFNKDAPVDRASHFSPPPESGRGTPAQSLSTTSPSAAFGDDDDPFGLAEASKRSNRPVAAPTQPPFGLQDDDDILGDLGKPISSLPNKPPVQTSVERQDVGSNRRPGVPLSPSDSDTDDDGGLDSVPKDRALAELIEMGFPADTARIALNETNGNVQNAVGWLLNQAHEESRQKSRSETPASRKRSPRTDSRSPPRQSRNDREAVPSWMRSQESSRASSAARQREHGAGEKDPSQMAQELGNKMWKSANSLWKASQKQMAKTIADFQQDQNGSDSGQPKWMRDSSADLNPPRRQQPDPQTSARRTPAHDQTDEAAALDAPRDRPQKASGPQTQNSELPSRGRSPVEPLPQRPSPQPRFMQQPSTVSDRRPIAKLSRQEVDEQSAQAYVSPARRKRPTPQPPIEPVAKADDTVDLFSSALPAPTSRPLPSPSTTVTKRAPQPPSAPARPPAPARKIPSVSPTSIQASASNRKAGGEHFKRGDYAAAHDSYTAALTPLPSDHPITIVILSNRALTGLKIGDAKTAVADSDRALELIGPSQGMGENIELGGGEGNKDMKDFYGKALMRKAEALEHMEKYGDAAAVWRQAVEGGFGGAVSLRGRDRCERAAAPKPPRTTASAPPRTQTTKAPPKSLGSSQPPRATPSSSSGEAVMKLRAANAEATKEEDEKFVLSDSVDAKLAAWKGSKSDNLRALLQSMDVVLWPDAGWKKVGMSDLVMPARVKIVYMKAIGKVHPDKIPQTATTEQRMISAAVFSTLNEAWDKFKTENNL